MTEIQILEGQKDVSSLEGTTFKRKIKKKNIYNNNNDPVLLDLFIYLKRCSKKF